jgi:predicted transcriptional regulator YheO
MRSVINMSEFMNLKIGEAAGLVYHRLEEGECSLNQIKTHLSMNGFDSQLALMAVGWLAREDKISINRESNRWSVRLNE